MTQEMWEKAVDIYPSTLMHLRNCFKTQKLHKKVVDTCPFILDYVPDCYKMQKMCKKVFLKKCVKVSRNV